MQVSITTPPATCAPWKPVIVKKHEANRLTSGRKWPVGADAGRVVVAVHQLVVFVDLDARGSVEPISTVASRKTAALAARRRAGMAARARTIVTDEQIRMKVLSGRQVDAQRVGQRRRRARASCRSSAARPRPRRRRRRAPSASSSALSWDVRPLIRACGHLRRSRSLGLVSRSSPRLGLEDLDDLARGRTRPTSTTDAPGVLEQRVGEVGAGGKRLRVGGRGAARAEDDVRADQAGEEHDLGGQEEPHRDLAGRHRRVLDGRRRGRRDVVGELGLGRRSAACAIASSTLRGSGSGATGDRQAGIGFRSRSIRIAGR